MIELRETPPVAGGWRLASGACRRMSNVLAGRLASSPCGRIQRNWHNNSIQARNASNPSRLLLSAIVSLLLGGAGNATAGVILQDFFGSTNDFQNGILTRHDAAGNTVLMQGNKGPTLIGIDGLRAQFPDTGAAVWIAPGVRNGATWFFAQASIDPFEPATPGDNNLVLAAGADAGTGGDLAALLPFTPPAVAYQVSADMIPEGGDLRDWVAIGLTSSLTNQTNNFETFGQAWLMLKMNATGLGPTTWELHTNGMAGTFLTGSTMLTGNFIPLELFYDPVAHLVSGSISGVRTPSISYTATGIVGVGMEAVEHVSFGIADNFAVQTGAAPAPGSVPEPGTYEMLLAGLALLGCVRRRRK